MSKRVAILFGGYTSEAGVSERSMQGLMQMMDSKRYNLVPVRITPADWQAELDGNVYPIDRTDFSYIVNGEKQKIDFCYITIHGAPGENGLMGGYFEMIGMPYSTCPSMTSAMTYDKWVCNTFLRGCGVTLAQSVMISKGEKYDKDAIVKQLGLPVFVKPAAGGSSFGVSKVKSIEAFDEAVAKALKESDEVLVEQFLDGTEVTCGLFKANGEFTMFPLTEVRTKNEFFDYEAKYTPGVTEEITPAEVADEVRDKVYATAQRVYNLMSMRGIVRIDFIIVKGVPYLLEVNTTPGMTVTSFIPQQIRAAGFTTQEIFNKVIDSLAK